MYIENNEKYGLFPSRLISRTLAKASIVVLSAAAVMTPASAQDDANATLEEVIVTGLRGTMQSAQKIKFDSEQIVDSIVADDIANLPDRSVTETLQRIPGVTIDHFISRGDPEHFSGEGSGVAVRGLTQVRGEINGRDGFTANGGRSLSFEDVPPELLAGVDVYKNPSADMIEGGLGGTVNLRTRMPLDLDEQLISFTATANYQNLSEETTPAFSALYSNKWDTGMGEMGFLIDLAYSELNGRIDVLFSRPFVPYDRDGDTVDDAFIPRGADWRTENTFRERQGVYSAFQWRPTDDLEYYATVFRSEYDLSWDENAIFVDNNTGNVSVIVGDPNFADPVYNSNGVFQSGTVTDLIDGGIPMGADTRFANRKSVTTDISTGVEWQINSDWFASTDVQFVTATNDVLDSTVASGIRMPYITIDNALGLPNIVTDRTYMANPDNYYMAFTMEHEEDNEADQLAWRADAEYQFDSTPVLDSLKFGVRYANRESEIVDTGYHWAAVIQPWMQGTNPWDPLPPGDLPSLSDLGLADQAHTVSFDNFYRGGVPSPGVIVAPDRALAEGFPTSYYTIHNAALPFYNDGTWPFSLDADGNRVTNWAPVEINESHLNQQEQTVTSAYFLLRFGWEDIGLDGNVGARYVQTKNVASGYVVSPNPSAPANIVDYFSWPDMPIEISNTYNDTLPSLNLRWAITDEIVTRFAYSKAIGRPNFSDMKIYLPLYVNANTGMDGSINLDDYNGSADGGNPNLEPIRADQFDLSFEWYYSDIGSAWLNLFTKDIDGFIRTGTYVQNINGFDYTIQAPENQDKAEIDGWELGWRQFFESGFGLELSYTGIDSSTEVSERTIPVDTDGTEYSAESLPYEGLSENSYNAIFMFENDLISARLAYTWRDEFLVGIGANGFNGNHDGNEWRLPVFQDAYGQWDGSVFYNISDRYAVGLEANNLTNEELTLSAKQTSGAVARTFTVQDTRYALTFRAQF